MPLERQVVNVPFAKGLDTQPDPLQVEVGDLLVCENGIFTHVPVRVGGEVAWQ